jgi:hypothetical protein
MTVSTPANVALSISTTAASHARLRTSGFVWALWLPLFGVAFAGSGSRKKILLLVVVMLLAVGIFEIGCGGGSHMTPATTNTTTQASQAGTPAGTYSVTVVATSGSMQHTTGVQLVVK